VRKPHAQNDAKGIGQNVHQRPYETTAAPVYRFFAVLFSEIMPPELRRVHLFVAFTDDVSQGCCSVRLTVVLQEEFYRLPKHPQRNQYVRVARGNQCGDEKKQQVADGPIREKAVERNFSAKHAFGVFVTTPKSQTNVFVVKED
jgi:hypothetical protein